MIFSVVTPGVLHHEVLVSFGVFGNAIDHHAVVVGGFPVVVANLAEFLGDGQLVFAFNGCAGVGRTAPASSVGAGEVFHFEVTRNVGIAFSVAAAKVGLRHVGSPSKGVAVLHCGFHDFHELVQREVVAFSPAPVVLDFKNKLGVEGMVGVGSEADIVIGIQAEIVGDVGLRRVGLLADFNLSGEFTEVVTIDSVEVFFPSQGNFVEITLRNGGDVGRSNGIKLVEVEERVTVEGSGSGHGVLRNDAVVFEAIDGIIERTTL